MRECDIIVPVFNAYECVIACVESVLKNTDLGKDRLILIDDKSPDERILPMLREYAKNNPGKIILLENKKNLGFVGTVNKGMKYSKNDVLLLNSDTEVTSKWLQKIKECAYSNKYIATVTPLSNNATLASVPKMFEANDLPDGYSLAEMAKTVEKSSMELRPEIPTAHGFCMYIKREALDVVGYFDEEKFGKGYGEENDFSFRCLKYGYRNVLCDNTYILHKESQSFLDKKKYHDDELREKHPVAKQRLDYWNQIREIEKIGDNIGLAIGAKEERPNILILLHDFSNYENNLGGTTLHVVDIINGLRHKLNFHVLAPEGNFYKVYSFFKDQSLVTGIFEKQISVEDIRFYSNEYKQMVLSIMKEYGISFVHIHHMIGHCFDIVDACAETGIKYAVSLHDYYLVEATTGVLEKEVGDVSNDMVDATEWKNNVSRLLKNATDIFSPSNYVKNVFTDKYGVKKITTIEHGMNLIRGQKEIKDSNKKNIAFIGVMATHKGSEILDAMIKAAPRDIRIHLFGVKCTDVKRKGVFINHGEYKRNELPELLKKNNIDLVCILSLWPETYSYTTTEAIACGVPVMAFDIGAISERLKSNNIGYTIPYTKNEKVILGSIHDILSDRVEYEKKLDSINHYKIRAVSEMCADYEKIYDSNTKSNKIDFPAVRERMLNYQFVRTALRKNGSVDVNALKKQIIRQYLSKTKIGRSILNKDSKIGKAARSLRLEKRFK